MEKEQLVCIHCASIVYLKEEPSELVYRVNVEGTRNVIDLCLKKMWKNLYMSVRQERWQSFRTGSL